MRTQSDIFKSIHNQDHSHPQKPHPQGDEFQQIPPDKGRHRGQDEMIETDDAQEESDIRAPIWDIEEEEG